MYYNVLYGHKRSRRKIKPSGIYQRRDCNAMIIYKSIARSNVDMAL